MSAQHQIATRWPWRVLDRLTVTNDFKEIIADVSNTPHAEANARLISAAPDMLAALEDILPWASAYIESQRTQLHGTTPFQRIERAKNAIAKATSET